MANNKTFTMIKPDAVENGHIGAILEKINGAGFRIEAMVMTQLSRKDAEQFYAVHRERPFFGELVDYMTSGPIVAAILEKDNAVEDFRKLIGATNPEEAAEGTIRKLGLEGGLWALVTDDGRSIELIDCPEALKKNGARARVRGSRESAEVTIGMVGDAMTVDSFELL